MKDLPLLAQKFILHWGEMGTRWGINRTVAQVHAFLSNPLQLELRPGERPGEMHVRRADGRQFGGAGAVLFLAVFVWRARPLLWSAKVPGRKKVLHRIYCEVASRRSCDSGACLLP